MALTEEKTLVYSSKIQHRYSSSSHSQNSSPTCRLANHQLSAQRVEVKDISYNDDGDNTKRCIVADQYVFLVICHNCNLKWTELWRTSRWFIKNNGSEMR